MRRFAVRAIPIAAICSLLAVRSSAGTEVSLDELLAGWGVDIANTPVSVETLEPGLHVLRRAGGAVMASIGGDGVLLVDDQYEATVASLRATVRDLGGGDVDLVVNTHAHFDHADGNPVLGAGGARIIAQENARRRMTTGARLDYIDRYYRQPPYPDEGLPVITFPDRMTLHFNGETVDLIHLGAGHTDGDIAVYFRAASVVHVGDLYITPWPYIDEANGGSLSALVGTLQALVEVLDDETRIVSGHRPTASQADLRHYAGRIAIAYERLLEHARNGWTLEQVIAANPLRDLDDADAAPIQFLTLGYRSILADIAP